MLDFLSEFNLAERIPQVVIIAIMAYLVYDKVIKKKLGGGSGGGFFGGANRAKFRPMRDWAMTKDKNRIFFPAVLQSGDNTFCGQLANGKIVVAMGDIQYKGRKWETGFFLFDDIDDHNPEFLGGRGGKCNGVYCIGDDIYAIVTASGSNWQGTQIPRIWNVRGGKWETNWSFKDVPGSSSMEVFWTFVTYGHGNKYGDGNTYYASIKAQKQKFDDYRPQPPHMDGGHVYLYRSKTRDWGGAGKIQKLGKLIQKNGQPVAGTRSGHGNYIHMHWAETHGTEELIVGDFHSKTFTIYFRDRAWAEKNHGGDMTKGWVRLKYLPSPARSGSPWSHILRAINYPAKAVLQSWQGDRYYVGLAWCASYILSKKYGPAIGVGGWGKNGGHDHDRGGFITIKRH